MRQIPFLLVAAAAALAFAEQPVLRLIEIDPGHSHAAAIHSQMIPGISDEVHVYAPLGPELSAHLNRIAAFNARAANPTRWSVAAFAGPGYLDRMLREPPGNIVVLSGRNDKKIDYIEAALGHGEHVLADKPWIIERRDFPRLEAALRRAAGSRLIAYDCMTQRFDAAYQVQRELVSTREVFGAPDRGTPEEPAVRMKNLHALLKMGASGPSLRPAWYFDIHQQGEGIADVGTHLVDLVEWTLFPNEAIDYRNDVRVLRADRQPLLITRAEFERVTGEKAWPAYLKPYVKADRLEYFTNNTAVFTMRGVHVLLDVKWQYEAARGVGDSYFASYRGTRSRIDLNAGPAEHFVPEVTVAPNSDADRQTVLNALEIKLNAMRSRYPGIAVEPAGSAFHVVIPKQARTAGSYFTLLAERFLGYVRNPDSLPVWETPNLLAKYYVTTTAVAMARSAGK